MNKIIFMGSPEFSVPSLIALNNDPNIEIALVISQEDKLRNRNKLVPTAVKAKALELGLKTYEAKSVNSKESLKIIDEINPDFLVIIAYGQLIGDYLLGKYKDRIINIHSSLLPKYRGAAPMQAAILNGEKETGVCSMLIEKSMDTGDILSCTKISISDDDTIDDIHDRLAIEAGSLIVETINNYPDLYENRIEQNHELASYSKKITKEMGHIDFIKTAREIDLQMRALKGWPGTFAILEGKNVKIHKISTIDKYNNDVEGMIHKVDDNGVYVNCKDACIIIEELQFPNKKRMKVADYIKGNTIETGIKFQ